MKVVVFRGANFEKLYGAGYDTEFFDNQWKTNLSKIPEVTEIVYENSSRDKEYLKEKLKDADAGISLMIFDNFLDEELFKACPKLKYVATGAHGFGKFDAKAMKEYSVTATNTIYGDVTIAQFAMGLLLDICHNVEIHSNFYKKDKWLLDDPGIKKIFTRQYELYGKTVGIYGLGGIGLKFAEMIRGFGVNVIAYSRTKKTGAEYDFIEQVSFDELLERSDIISIHCPLTQDTQNTINQETIAKMKDGVIIINTARGAIIDEDALYDALQSKKVYAAGLDVVCGEPISKPCKLMECENAKITEHMAWITIESKIRSTEIMCENLANWINGNPTSVINK
ncbi:MAG: NAD(P)-dependent oxidoreductase [Clostridia bacterium]